MNHLTTYEQLVAEKLQQLPVPDMADAIWARISQQLDVDMPEDKSGHTGNGNTSLPGFQFPGNIIFYIFFAALVSVIFYLNRPGKHKPVIPAATSNTIAIPQGHDDKRAHQSLPGRKTETIYTDKADYPVDELKENPVTVNELPVIIPQAVETNKKEIVKKEELPPPTETVLKKVTTPAQDSVPKKGRGVKGITSADYRIAPVRRDSL